ncbi:MAG TPA: DNA polymerase III, partial [Chitinophaga sp.]
MKTHTNIKTMPPTLLELMDIRGITSDKIGRICHQLGISNLHEFTTAVAMNQLESIPSLTPENKKNIRQALKLSKDADNRMQLWEAMLQGKELLKTIGQLPEVTKAALAGSLRRGKDTIGDIDIVIQISGADRKKLLYKIDRMPSTANIIAAGNNRICIALHNQLLVYLYLTDEKHFGATLLYYTGSKNYNAYLEKVAAEKGYRFDPNGLYDL